MLWCRVRGSTCSVAVEGEFAFPVFGVVNYSEFVFFTLTFGSIYNSVYTQSCLSVVVRQSLMKMMTKNSGREM